MKIKDKNSIWNFKRAGKISHLQRNILLVFVAGGIVSILYFADWWFRAEHINSLWLFIVLSATFWWSMFRLILIWINYMGISNPEPVKAPKDLSVAIFTTSSPGEPLSMFDKTLKACSEVTYPHTTYLLDDTQDIKFKEAAERNGAVWLELVGLPGAKAGKINAALKLTKEDFILILDPDHIPFPNFLDNTLGFFNDEKMGFVQVSQAYYNQYRSFTAKGAAEQTYTFYGPTQMGLNGYGCSVAIGANCTFRRKALESIGGHGIGLAEDLITSIRIHAKGWKSVFFPVVISRGLVPEDFGSFCKQQLKWSRGVFEMTFVELPKLYKNLTFWQKLSYFTIGTYYFVGATQFFFIVIPFVFFLTGILPASMSFAEFIIRGSFIVFFSVSIYIYVQKWMCDPDTEKGLHWRGMILKFACWPVYLLGFLLSTVNAEIPYIPTAKRAVTGFLTPFARPLIVHSLLFIFTVTSVLIYRANWMPESQLILSSEKTWSMIGFALIAFLMALGGIYAAFESKTLTDEDPWEKVDLKKIKTSEDEN